MRKNILKKMALLSTFVMTSMFVSGYTPVEGNGNPDEWNIDNTQFVYDYGDVFSSDEELELQKLCESTGKELGLDIVIVSATDLGGMNEMNYADDFYDYGGYSESGILYLIDLDHDGVWVSTSGLAMVYIDDYDVETIIDALWVGFEKYDYMESAEDFVDTVDDIVAERKSDSDFKELEELWYEGEYDDYEDFKAKYSDEIYEAYEESFFTPFKNIFMCMGVGAIIALIAVLVMCISSGTKMTAGSKTYMRSGSFNILHRFDRFTHTTTTTRKVNTSSGSGGSRGHSSSHRSSSGRSHGGGGRRR